AEDGIRDRNVTGVQTCALPIWSAVVHDVAIADLLVGLPAAVLLVPLHLVGGAIGEELGWRGYVHNELRKRRRVVAASMITGLIWGCWHLPLWLVTGLTGDELALYVASFLVAIICCSLLIGVFYEQNRNLAIPMFIHFLNNYLLALFAVEASQVLPLFAAAYLLDTVALLIVTRDSMREKRLRQESTSAGTQGGLLPNRSFAQRCRDCAACPASARASAYRGPLSRHVDSPRRTLPPAPRRARLAPAAGVPPGTSLLPGAQAAG